MDTFLTELAKKSGERWVAMLALPGALYVVVLIAAASLGHARAVDVPLLSRRLTDLGSGYVGTPAGIAVAAVLLLLGAAAAGYVAQLLAAMVELIWLGTWRLPTRLPGPIRRWAARRYRRRLAVRRRTRPPPPSSAGLSSTCCPA